MKGVLFWIGIAVLIWWVVSNPHTAGTDVRNVGTFISSSLPHGG